MDALPNLFRPWILARLLAGLTAAGVCVTALVMSQRLLSRWKLGSSSEGQLLLERRAELVAALVQVALFGSLIGLVLTVVGADRTSESIRGAMCAYGVFGSTTGGWLSLAASGLTALCCALWLIVHRLDLRHQKATLTRLKFLGLLWLAPIVVADLALYLRYALSLDLSVVATCCSTGLDGAVTERWGAASGHGFSRSALFYGALGFSGAAVLAGLWLAKTKSALSAATTALLSTVAFTAMLPTVLLYVAPHAYETPRHLCPFCLLHGDVGGIGWPLFGGLFFALSFGLGSALCAVLGRGEPAAKEGMLSLLGRRASFAWLVVLLTAIAPVLRFHFISGGASLFP